MASFSAADGWTHTRNPVTGTQTFSKGAQTDIYDLMRYVTCKGGSFNGIKKLHAQNGIITSGILPEGIDIIYKGKAYSGPGYWVANTFHAGTPPE